MTPDEHTDLLAELHGSIVSLERSVRELVRVVAHDDDSTGVRVYRNEALLANVEAARTEPGRVTYLHAYNTNVVDVFLHLFDHLQDQVIPNGARKPKLTVVVPGNGGGYDNTFARPIPFIRAISVAITANKDGSGGAPAQGVLVDVVSAELE